MTSSELGEQAKNRQKAGTAFVVGNNSPGALFLLANYRGGEMAGAKVQVCPDLKHPVIH